MNANGTEKKKHSSENSVFVICIYIKTFSPLNIDIPLVKIFFTNLTFQSIFELRFQYLRNIRKESLKLLHIRKGWGGGSVAWGPVGELMLENFIQSGAKLAQLFI